MIKSEPIREPNNLYIKYSVIIELDNLEIIHQKLVQSGCSKIDYLFPAHHTRYTCENINDIRNVFVREGLSEIAELEIDCRNNDNKKVIDMIFKKHSLLFEEYFLKIHPSDTESQSLAEEIFSILNEKNIYNFKRLANKIVSLKKMAYSLLFTDLVLTLSTNTLPDNYRNYAQLLTLAILLFSIFVIQFSSKQKVKIYVKKDSYTLEYKDIIINLIISIIGSFIVYLITTYFFST